MSENEQNIEEVEKNIKQDSLVKKTCKTLQIDIKELAITLGASVGTVRNWSSSDNPPQWAINFMNYMVESRKDKIIADKFREIFYAINDEPKN